MAVPYLVVQGSLPACAATTGEFEAGVGAQLPGVRKRGGHEPAVMSRLGWADCAGTAAWPPGNRLTPGDRGPARQEVIGWTVAGQDGGRRPVRRPRGRLSRWPVGSRRLGSGPSRLGTWLGQVQ